MNALGVDVGGTTVKCALMRDGEELATARTPMLDPSTPQGVRESVRTTVTDAAGTHGVDVVACCLPGRIAASGDRIEQSVNVPGLNGVPFGQLLGLEATPKVVSDAEAAAVDFDATNPGEGRLLAVSLGTGVGAAVLDGGVPLRVVGGSPGHFGQMDVTLDARDAPVGPDGGRGTLEAYVGARALRARFGDDIERELERLDETDPILLALARALRIAHAIYRPRRIALLGGVGLALRPAIGTLGGLVRADLTDVAEEGWTLGTGSTIFHAARGAARIAAGKA